MEQSGVRGLAGVAWWQKRALLKGSQLVCQLEATGAEHTGSGPTQRENQSRNPLYRLHRRTRAVCTSELNIQAFGFMHSCI